MPTITTAAARLPNVMGTSYRIVVPGTSNPSMAMKCMSQMAVPPMATAARASQRARRPGSDSRARAVSTRPNSEPMNDMTYAMIGLIGP